MPEHDLGDDRLHRFLLAPVRRLIRRFGAASVVGAATALSVSFSLLMVDVDHFKRVNDTYGHAAGDEVLRRLVGVCSAHLRRADVTGRMGGEEFLVLLPSTDEQAAVRVAEELRLVLASTVVEVECSQLQITVSIGVATRRATTASLEDLIKEADDALYRAKAAGRDRVVSGATEARA